MRETAAAILLFLAALPARSRGVTLEEPHELVKRDSAGHWDYSKKDATGPGNWANLFKKCGGERQSPIDINSTLVDLNPLLSPFEFDNYDDNLDGATIKNNGHTVQVIPGAKDSPCTFTGGGLDDEYKLLQLHFHWGSSNKRGSEHTMNGKAFPLEMHFVHMNTHYKSVAEALGKEDGLAVLGVLFKLSSDDNPDLTPIIDKLDEIRKKGSEVDLGDIQLEDLLPDDLMPYYRYQGSLTTPACNEIVTWTVFKDFVPISERQLQQFRNIKEDDNDNLVDNFRPVQLLGERKLEVSGDEDHSAASSTIVAPAAVFLLLGILVVA